LKGKRKLKWNEKLYFAGKELIQDSTDEIGCHQKK
jgi:hypothetical protein